MRSGSIIRPIPPRTWYVNSARTALTALKHMPMMQDADRLGLGTADGVRVGFYDLPTLAAGVVLDSAELKLPVLIGELLTQVQMGGSHARPQVLRNLKEHSRGNNKGTSPGRKWPK